MINQKRVLVFGILFILAMQTVLALGVTPGRTTLQFPDDLDRHFEFTILNPEGKPMTVDLRLDGILQDYVDLSYTQYTFSEGETSKTITFKVDEDFNDIEGLQLEPGEYHTKIIISESLTDPEVAFGAKMAVVSEILLRIPYPDQYVEAAVDVLESDKDEITTFVIPVINRGMKSIDQVFADVEIYRYDELVGSTRSNSVILDGLERDELKAEWKADVPIGTYKALVTIYYGNITIKYWEEFKVGKLSIDVFDLFVEDFQLGNIVKLDVLVENRWSETLKEVYAQLILYDEFENKIADVKSPPYDLRPAEKTRLPLYWDTIGLEEGDYEGKIIIHYKEFSVEQDLYVDISKYGIGLELASGGFVLEKENDIIKSILVGLIIFAVIFLIIYKKFIRRK